jgi:arylsulfatase A-like enzyme
MTLACRIRPRQRATGHRRCVLVLLMVHLVGGAGACSEADHRPNVLLYIVDTLRVDAVGAYGKGMHSTPAIDRFVGESVLFENAFANSSWTRASVASILTGRYAHRHGTEGRNDVLSEEVDTLASLLSREGYATGFVNANPNTGSAFGFARGVDEMIELYTRRLKGRVEADELIATAPEVTERALDWIRNVRRPFFAVVLVVDPHAPYSAPQRFNPSAGYLGPANGEYAWIDRPLAELSGADRKYIHDLYDSEVRYVDESFGALISGLRADGTLDRTLTFFTSDHGEEFWEYDERRGHGESLTDPATHVPLLVRFPEDARVEAGTRVAREVELVDIVPTVMDLLAIGRVSAGDGRSLFAAPQETRRPVFASLNLDGIQIEAVRSAPWKLLWDGNQDEYRMYLLRSSRRERRPSAITRKNRPTLVRLQAHLDEIRGPSPSANKPQ